MATFKIMSITIICFNVIISSVFGQKLPHVQQISLRAPKGIKIDGKIDDWNNQFHAFNSATGIFYTLSNDDQNLYLTVQAPDDRTINRIVARGLTLTVSRSKIDKNNLNKVSITYPLSTSNLIFDLKGRSNSSPEFADSVMRRNNKILEQKTKWIGVNGITGVDSLISIYNLSGISAAQSFDVSKKYTLELSVSLQQIHSALNPGNSSLYYEIRVNGMKPVGEITPIPVPGSNDPATLERVKNMVNMAGAMLSAPTFFYGEYSLAK